MGGEKIYVRKTAAPSKSQIKKALQFKKLMHNNSEWAG
jgi:hypothetical protein